MKLRTLAVLIVITAFCCAGCLQELPLGDKYINEAVGHLRVQNTSTQASYVITAVELRNSAGEVIKTWEGLGQDGQGLRQGETWTGDLDLEGSFILYCTVQNTVEGTAGTFKYEYPVEIKLHEVAESGITGELYLSTTDTDEDGFSDFWENTHKNEGFNPEDPADGGMVYVSTTVKHKQLGTAEYPYSTLAAGVEKAMYGLGEKSRTVMVLGELKRIHGNEGSDTSVFSIRSTGLHGVTIEGNDSTIIDAEQTDASRKRVLYLGPGTNVTLKNIILQNGRALRGGGIYVEGAKLTLGQGAVVRNCSSDAGSSSGAGIHAFGDSVVIMEKNSCISENSGLIGAAVALLNGSSLTMKDESKISENILRRGAAVFADLGSLITLGDNAEITDNKNGGTDQAITHGGGVRLTGGSRLIMEGGRISGNILDKGNGGGGVYVGPESVFEMRGGEISGNSVGGDRVVNTVNTTFPGNGGGVYVDLGGTFSMTGGFISKNTAESRGGGVYIDGGKFFKTGGAVYGSNDVTNGNTAKAGGHALAFPGNGQAANDTLPVSGTY
jgi:hypothetical protein